MIFLRAWTQASQNRFPHRGSCFRFSQGCAGLSSQYAVSGRTAGRGTIPQAPGSAGNQARSVFYNRCNRWGHLTMLGTTRAVQLSRKYHLTRKTRLHLRGKVKNHSLNDRTSSLCPDHRTILIRWRIYFVSTLILSIISPFWTPSATSIPAITIPKTVNFWSRWGDRSKII